MVVVAESSGLSIQGPACIAAIVLWRELGEVEAAPGPAGWCAVPGAAGPGIGRRAAAFTALLTGQYHAAPQVSAAALLGGRGAQSTMPGTHTLYSAMARYMSLSP